MKVWIAYEVMSRDSRRDLGRVRYSKQGLPCAGSRLHAALSVRQAKRIQADYRHNLALEKKNFGIFYKNKRLVWQKKGLEHELKLQRMGRLKALEVDCDIDGELNARAASKPPYPAQLSLTDVGIAVLHGRLLFPASAKDLELSPGISK